MSVRQGLLALLAERPMYGAQLRTEFEARTGGTWPLNVGQVYTTLARLERDLLVEAAGGPDEDGRIAYRLTEEGRVAVGRWWLTPVDRDDHPRSELAIKLALAVTLDGVDVPAVVQVQRSRTLRSLQDLTRLKRQADAADDLAWTLVLEHLVFAAEAEVRWLDHVEARLHRAAAAGRARVQPPAEPPAPGPVAAAGARAPGSTRTSRVAPTSRTASTSRTAQTSRTAR
jgi:DNA-binding PadR family transcriptional regulator